MAEFRYSLTAPDVLTGVIYLIEHNLDNDTAYFIDVYTDAEEARDAVDELNRNSQVEEKTYHGRTT